VISLGCNACIWDIVDEEVGLSTKETYKNGSHELARDHRII